MNACTVVSELIREDMVFGERMAKVNRGTEGHFPYPDDELVEVLETSGSV